MHCLWINHLAHEIHSNGRCGPIGEDLLSIALTKMRVKEGGEVKGLTGEHGGVTKPVEGDGGVVGVAERSEKGEMEELGGERRTLV